MNQLTEALGIAATEHRYDFVCSIAAEIVTSLENQGFDFDELLDGLANYAFVNNRNVETACNLQQACLSARKVKKPLETTDAEAP